MKRVRHRSIAKRVCWGTWKQGRGRGRGRGREGKSLGFGAWSTKKAVKATGFSHERQTLALLAGRHGRPAAAGVVALRGGSAAAATPASAPPPHAAASGCVHVSRIEHAGGGLRLPRLLGGVAQLAGAAAGDWSRGVARGRRAGGFGGGFGESN